MSDPPSPRLRRAKHRRVRAGLALAANETESECGQRASFNSEANLLIENIRLRILKGFSAEGAFRGPRRHEKVTELLLSGRRSLCRPDAQSLGCC
jgi:hypothetical protein